MMAVDVWPVTTLPKSRFPFNPIMRCIAAPACITVQVRAIPPPKTTTAPVREDVEGLVATLNVTVPLLTPELPPVIAIHEALETAVHGMFPVTPIVRPLAAELEKLVLAGLIVIATAAPACVTMQVREIPPPATMTAPVREDVKGLVATLNVTVPLLTPELPPVIAIHEALETAVHGMFPVTPIVRPLAAELEKLVLVGLIAIAAAAPACVTMQVREIPPPAMTTAPVREDVAGLDATLKATVPLLTPELPPVTTIHDTFDNAVHDTFAVTLIIRPLAAALEKLVLGGAITSVAAAPACITVQVRTSPAPATVIEPVREDVLGLVATL